ncbi:PREDICTED: histone-lysine N-methyltransferase SMYD3-like [Priapulus caudatus]|uniref:Histone-lysine N-methyltransferase SMYD3-like n=1 Tax=Priapulus caudatus TaxID=37621 RepID=A0ABM1E4Q7_PRICU|nr:PREDICTED: histone-lysine N-methyltransferase SMYD3-like [Priapulus caudatus]
MLAVDMRAGDLLITAEPYVYVLSNKFRARLCDSCLGRFDRLSRCSCCKFVRYCSRSCQDNDWTDHRLECKALQKVAPNVPTDSARLMARVIWKLNRLEMTAEETHYACNIPLRGFNDLMTHCEDIKRDGLRGKQFGEMVRTLREYVRPEDMPEPRDLLHIFGRIVINSFTLTDMELNPIGVGLYLGPSVIDHSCQPNMVTTFIGPVLQQRAISDIPGGSYTHDALKRSTKCGNVSCTGAVTRAADLSFYPCQVCGFTNFDATYHKQVEKAEKMTQETLLMIENSGGQDPALVLQQCESCLRLQRQVMHPLCVNYVRVLDKAMDACIDQQLWEQAVQYGLQTIECYRRFHPTYDPNVGRQLMKIGKLQLYLEHLEDALTHLQQADEILVISMGAESPLVVELKALLEQCATQLCMRHSL